MGSAEPRFHVKDIAVVGAGPCGLAAARYLVAQGAFSDIVVYEQQPEVGGVWYYSERPSETLHVPQVSPFCPPDPPVRPGGPGSPGGPPVFPSPMYELLHTNIPAPLMAFSDLEFPRGEGTLIFPSRQTVQEYLVRYSQDIRHLIRFSTQVTNIRLTHENGRDRWHVTSGSTLGAGEVSSRVFDAVVVASGHYATTYIPDIPRIREFHKAHPGIITHSKLYRRPEAFAGKKVIVVGNAASGLDIATQISPVCQQPLLLSVQTPTPPLVLPHVGAEEVPVIEEFLVDERGVRFAGGRVEKDVDAVLFSTGYLFSFPFLETLDPPLLTNGRRVYGLYKDLIYIEHPTLAFPGLPIKVVPFPLSESQAAIVARSWANSLALPSREEMRRWEEEAAKERGPAFHVYPKGGDVEYINQTHAWLARSGSVGKEPPLWDDELVWERKVYVEAKLKFELTGRKASSLEELGFHYTPSGEEQPKEPEIL